MAVFWTQFCYIGIGGFARERFFRTLYGYEFSFLVRRGMCYMHRMCARILVCGVEQLVYGIRLEKMVL